MASVFSSEKTIGIDWADLDLFGHVNNVAFFRYIQSARVELCESLGLTSLLDSSKPGFMVVSSQCRFKKPLHFPGNIRVATGIDWLKNTSFQISYKMFNDKQELTAEGEDVIVVFDHAKKVKLDIPAFIREKIGPQV